jgi:adenosylhomocysteinase
MAKMKNNAIVGNIGHFDNEIETEGLKKWPGIVRTNIKPQVDKWTFEDGHSIILLAEGTIHNLLRSFIEFRLRNWTSFFRYVNFFQ